MPLPLAYLWKLCKKDFSWLLGWLFLFSVSSSWSSESQSHLWVINYVFCSVKFSHSVVSHSLQPHGLAVINTQSLLKLRPIGSEMPFNYLTLGHPLLLLPSIFPSIRVFSNETVLCIRKPSVQVSASASVLPMNIKDWFPLGWTGWISIPRDS